MKIDLNIINQRQNFPLEIKIIFTMKRIREWYELFNGRVFVSFSGGKDSTVLLFLVRQIFPHIPAVFVDTGMEYPEIREFVKTIKNVIWIKPKMSFKEVIKKYGYPVISKDQARAIERYRNTKCEIQKYRRLHGWPRGTRGMISKKWQYLIDAPFLISDKCCDVMKKEPLNRYAKKTRSYPMIGIMASESIGRKILYSRRGGCNAFNQKNPISWPMAIWNDIDIWEYIKQNNISYSKIYDMGENRTGCMFCMFGIQYDKGENRFQRMKRTHYKQWDFCMKKLGCLDVLNYMGFEYENRELFSFEDYQNQIFDVITKRG